MHCSEFQGLRKSSLPFPSRPIPRIECTEERYLQMTPLGYEVPTLTNGRPQSCLVYELQATLGNPKTEQIKE